MENEEQFLDSYHQQSNSLRRHSNRSQRSTLPDERIIETTYPTDAVVNPAYMHDEEYIINGNYENLLEPGTTPKSMHLQIIPHNMHKHK